MLGRLFFIFSMVTLVELSILIPLGKWMGLGPTILLVLGTGFLGAWLARREGLRAWLRFQKEAQSGKMPTDPILDGLAIFTAALLLMTPGILTDVVGFLLLIPIARAPLKAHLRKRAATMTSSGGAGLSFFQMNIGGQPGARNPFEAGPTSTSRPSQPPSQSAKSAGPKTPKGRVFDSAAGGRVRDAEFINKDDSHDGVGKS